mgnify:FL=1
MSAAPLAPRLAPLLLLALGSCPGDQARDVPPPAAADLPLPAPAPADLPLPAPAPPKSVQGSQVLTEVTSPLSKIRVRQQRTRRSLAFVRKRGDELVQSLVDLEDPDTPTLAYTRAMAAAALLLVDDPRQLLLVGLGGGTLVRFAHARLPRAELDVVELDPEVVRLAAAWFGVVPGPRLRIHTGDGARYLETTDRTYDIIWLDAFLEPGPTTDNAGVPAELRQQELLRTLRARLRPGGVAAFNIHFLSGYREHVDAIAAAFPRVYMLTSRDSNERIVLALERDQPLDLDALPARAAALDAAGTWGIPFAAILDGLTPWQAPSP